MGCLFGRPAESVVGGAKDHPTTSYPRAETTFFERMGIS